MKKILLISVFFITISCSNNSQITLEQVPDNSTIIKSNNFLKINPHLIAPLSAELHIQAPNTDLTITVKGQDGEDSDISYTWKNATNTIFPILGMYFQYTNTIIISTPALSKTIQIVITNQASEYITSIEVLVNNRPINEERKNFLNFFNPVSSLKDLFATDNYGKIRWYLSSTNELHAMKFNTSNNEVQFSILNTVAPEVLTYNMLGKLVNIVKGPKEPVYNVKEADKRYHHDFFYRDNGNIIILDKSQYGVEDAILEVDSKGTIVKEIQIGDWIRKTINNNPKDNTELENFIFDSEDNPFDEYASGIRYPGMPEKQNAIDWAHINAMDFDKQTDTIYLSFRQHGIFAFDYNTETLKWIFIRKDYTIPFTNRLFYNLPDTMDYVYNIPSLAKYILKGINGPDHTHSISFLSNNQFMVFDNSGDDGNYPAEGSRLLVFSVNDETKTATLDWEYRHTNQDGTLVYSQIVSDIDKTPFNSYIGTFGTTAPFPYVEIDANNKVIFDMRLNITARGTGESDVALPIACPTSRLMQNGVVLYRSDYNSIYPSIYKSID